MDIGNRTSNAATLIAQTSHQQAMHRAWSAYTGTLPDPLIVVAGDPNDNVKINRCRPIVDKGVSFLFGKTLAINVDANAEVGAQEYLNTCWGHDDNKMVLLCKLAKHGGISGNAFVKIIPPSAQGKPCRMVVLDPLNCEVITAPEDIDTVIAYTITYDTIDPLDSTPTQKRQVIQLDDPDGLAIAGEPDDDATWIITNQIKRGGKWVALGEPQVWDYPWAPIADCQNLVNPSEHWGTPDLTDDIISINQQLNFIESNIARIIKHHGHPYIWGTGFKASELTITPGRVIVLPSHDSKLNALQAYGNIAEIMAFAEDLRQDMDEESRVPAVALGRMKDLPRGISGIALQMLFQPLIEKTIEKQRLYGNIIRDLCKRMLVLGGYDYDTEIMLIWQDLLPADDIAAAQVAAIYAQLGISKSTILSRLGFDPDVEATQLQDEQTQQVTSYAQGRGLPPPAQPMMAQGQQNATGGPPQ